MHLPLISKAAGFIANISSNIAFLPQIIKSYQRKRVEDVSIGMFCILFFTQVCWVLYAVPIGAQNLWTSSLIEIALLLPLFVMWFKYKPRKPNNANNNAPNLPLINTPPTITSRLNYPTKNMTIK